MKTFLFCVSDSLSTFVSSVKTNLLKDGAVSRLYIARANKHDSGNYTCGMRNAQASVTVHILNGESGNECTKNTEIWHHSGRTDDARLEKEKKLGALACARDWRFMGGIFGDGMTPMSACSLARSRGGERKSG